MLLNIVILVLVPLRGCSPITPAGTFFSGH